MGGGGQAGGRRVLPVAPHGSDLPDRTAGGAAANRASDKNPAEKRRLPLWKGKSNHVSTAARFI